MENRLSHVFLFTIAAVFAALLAGGCVDQNISFEVCETNADCDALGDETLDYCGQEGINFCCGAGGYKCGCVDDLTCRQDYICYECNGTICGNGQPTICLDGIAGGAAGLSPVQ